jgi:hypothetical protein
MGVMACDREGCENIMCERGNAKYYICWECYAELMAHIIDIEEFMSSPKPTSHYRTIERHRQDVKEAFPRL